MAVPHRPTNYDGCPECAEKGLNYCHCSPAPKTKPTPGLQEMVSRLLAIKETNSVLSEVQEERRRQDKKWGEQNHTPPEWLSILGEEFGEVCKAVCEAHFSGYESTGNWENYRTELIQLAAVAVAMVECLDRNTHST